MEWTRVTTSGCTRVSKCARVVTVVPLSTSALRADVARLLSVVYVPASGPPAFLSGPNFCVCWPPWWGNSVVRIYLCLSLSVSRASRKSRIMGNENSTRRNVWTGLQLGRSLTLSTRTIPVFIGTTRQFSHKSSEWN